MNAERIKKIEHQAHIIMSNFLSKDLPDSDKIFGIINISQVKLSPDASYLDMIVSSFENKELLTKTLAKYAYLIQREIGLQLKMRKNPRVRFRYDESGEIGQHITQTINSLDYAGILQKLQEEEV